MLVIEFSSLCYDIVTLFLKIFWHKSKNRGVNNNISGWWSVYCNSFNFRLLVFSCWPNVLAMLVHPFIFSGCICGQCCKEYRYLISYESCISVMKNVYLAGTAWQIYNAIIICNDQSKTSHILSTVSDSQELKNSKKVYCMLILQNKITYSIQWLTNSHWNH